MYKDVWKKFGLKILIIFCSVMLLGGVAVAAPRLRASNKISLADAVANGQLTANTVRYSLDPNRFNADGTPAYDTVGSIALPTSFEYRENPTDTPTQIPVGVIQVNTISSDDTYRSMGTKQVQLSISGGASDLFEDTTDAVVFSYNIERGQYTTLSNQKYTPTEYEVQQSGYPNLSQNDLEVKVTYNGREYTLPKNEIYFSTSENPITGAGTYQHYIAFANFTSTNAQNNDASGRAKHNMSLYIKKNVRYLTAYYDGKVLNSDYAINRNQTMDISKLRIVDGTTDIYGGSYPSTNSPKVSVEFTTTGVSKPFLRITGVDGTGYFGTYDLEFSFEQSGDYFVLPDAAIFPRVIDYDDYNGYINKPKQLTGSKGGTYTINNDYTVSDDSFVFIENDNSNEIDKKYNPTAGRVRFRAVGINNMAGVETPFNYHVSRNLAGTTKANVVVTSHKEFIYDTTPQVPELEVSFTDSYNGKSILRDKDYTVSYNYYNQSTGSMEPLPSGDKPVNAGTYEIVVTGTGSKDAGGYYGKTSTTFEVKPKVFDSANYELRLKGLYQTEKPATFFYTGDVPEMKNAVVVDKDKNTAVENVGNWNSPNYTVKIFKGTVEMNIEDDEFPDGDDYRIVYTFGGNYGGTLEAPFKIVAYGMSQCSIVLHDQCTHDTKGGNNEHIYDGTAHDPDIEVWYHYGQSDQIELPESSYEKVYIDRNGNESDNINAGTVALTVRSVNNPDDKKTTTFVIQPQTLADPQLPVDEYTNGKHDYAGQSYPALDTVTLAKMADPLNLNTDYTIEGLYYWNGTDYEKVTAATYPKVSDAANTYKYAFKITGKGNYQGDAFTNEFELTPKSIGNTTMEIPDKPRSDTSDNATYVNKSLKVYDKDFGGNKGTLLVLGTDYIIESIDPSGTNIPNDLDKNGEIKVTIKGIGCYTGTNTVTYHYGDSIKKVSVFRKRQPLTLRDGAYWIEGTFTAGSTNSGYNDIIFLENGGILDNSIYLQDGNEKLYYNENYTINATYENLNGGDGDRLVTITVTGQHGYWDSIVFKFYATKSKIANVEIKNEDIYGNTPLQYTGQEVIPVIVVKDTAGKELQKDIDYKATFGENINAGVVTVTITGRGDYEGTIEKQFTIAPRDISNATTEKNMFHIDYSSKIPFAYETVHNEEKKDNRPGACPPVEISFSAKGTWTSESTVEMQEYIDFKVTYQNSTHAWEADYTEDLTKPKPSILVEAQGANFTGQFTLEYEISRIPLSECQIDIPEYMLFNGEPQEPEIKVYYQGMKLDPAEYSASIDNNVLVRDKESKSAFVTLTHTKDGNCSGFATKEFKIRGNFSRTEADAANNSYIVTTPNIIPYGNEANPIGNNPKYLKDAWFYQRKKGENAFNPREMMQGTDYNVDFDAASAIVGRHNITIEGINDFIGFYRGSSETNNGQVVPDPDGQVRECYFYIQGDLKTQATYTQPGVISYVPGQSLSMQDMIKPVVCGGKTLVYGVDYTFRAEPEYSIGKHTVVLEPTGDAKNYLKNTLEISYEVKQGIDGITANIKDSYEYNHGHPVVTKEDITITLNGKPLKPNDYDLSFLNDNNINVTAVSGAALIVTGKGDYSGETRIPFTITAYDFTKHYADGDIDLGADETVPYTGSEVFPTVNHIKVQTSRYGEVDLTKKDPVEYRLVGAGEGDRINYTKPGAEKPKCQIRSANNNYTGFIEFEYSILQKDINSEGIEFEAISDQKYLNGREIKPIPSATYAGRQLSKVLYNIDTDYSNTRADFSYEYVTDCRNVNTHQIRIRGIGNFTGETVVEFEIIPKNIEDEDVELVFTGDPLVYNGQEQIPAFDLKYAGDTILSYNGSDLIYLIMKAAQLSAEHNKNVNDGAVLTIKAVDPNYTGSKKVQFKIDPASLQDHTKFVYRLNVEERVDLGNYKLNLPFGDDEGNPVARIPAHAATADTLAEGQVGTYFNDTKSANNGTFLIETEDYDIERMYVEPDTDDVEIREEYRHDKQKPPFSWAGKVMVTITGKGNYTDSARYWYYIGTDISSEATIRMEPTTAVYNSQKQPPSVIVSGVEEGRYTIAKYKDEVALKNLIEYKDFVNAATYYIRIEGNPSKGTYATKPHTLTYTITPRPLSNSLVIDGFKKEYPYTGLEIRPIGISVTDYIDRIKYRLTEDLDYTLSYKNNLNAGTAFIEVQAKGNFSGSASANFLITSSTISSGSGTTPDTPINGGIGEISGSTPVSPNNVILTMDTANAMFYTGNAVYPKVSIAGMTENIDYTVTFSNNIEVGVATVTITGIGNNRGTITKTFNIIAPLSKCTIAPIPAQQYTGSPVTPTLTVTCGKNILIPGTDYNVTYSNNVNIGTATVTINAANNSKYTGSAKATFSIGNDVGGFIISGYAPTYTYTGNAITPSVVVETGSDRLTQGTDYTVSYSNNINAGKATITVKGVGKYSGTQTANFMIEAKSIAGCDTTEVEDRTYTGDAYTPSITVTDGTKVLTNGVDYTLTYTNNKEPGTASILIQGTSNNYSGTKIVNFKIAAVAVKGLKATNVKYSSLKLKWTKQGYADGYQICDAQSKVIKNVTKNSATISKLSTGKTYRYKVRSYIRNADGTRSYGAFSSVISATTKLKTPVVKVVSKKTGQARISWSKVAGADGYEIYYKKSSKDTYRKLKTVNNANVRICNVRGMKSGDRAYFRVRAFKKNGSKKVYSAMNKLKVITVK